MNEKNDKLKIIVPFDEFFDVLNLGEVKLEKKRQELIKGNAIVEINGQECVLLRKCAKYVLDELNLLRTIAMLSRSHYDIRDYALTSLGYLRVWCSFLTGEIPSEETSRDAVPTSGLTNALQNALDDYHKIYEHLRTALVSSHEINLSANSDNKPDESHSNTNNVPVNGQDKGHFIEDEDCATLSIPFELFTGMVKLGGAEMEKRYQDLTEKVEIATINGKEHILLTRYIIYVLDDLEYLCSRAKTFHLEKAIEDYAFFSFQYLHIWTHILLGRAKLETPSGDKVSNDFLQGGWKNALDYFQAIYRYTHDAIVISLENGPLVSSKE